MDKVNRPKLWFSTQDVGKESPPDNIWGKGKVAAEFASLSLVFALYVSYVGSERATRLHAVIETDSFIGSAKEAEMSDQDREALVVFLAKNPDAGDLIPGTGGARKFRIPFKGKGKSGGARVVTYFAGDDIPVFLLEVYAKGDKINLSKRERNDLRAILGEIADAYREGLKEKMRFIGSAS